MRFILVEMSRICIFDIGVHEVKQISLRDIRDYRKCPCYSKSTGERRATMRREPDIILYCVITAPRERRIIGIRRGHVNTRLITHLHF